MVDFETELMSKLADKKKLAESSINYYLRNLRKLNEGNEIKNLNFLNDKNKIDEFIKKKKPNTQRNYYITIVSILGLDEKKKALKEYYSKIMDGMNKELKEKEAKNEKSETQKQNWIEEKDLKELYSKYKDAVDKFKKDKDISGNKYDTLLKYVVLSLYTLIPPRRNKDYQETLFVKGINQKEFDEDYNYIDMTNKKMIFNNFKTKKSEGTQEFDIPNDLFSVLEIYQKFHPLIDNVKKYEVPFLVDYEGMPLDQVNSMTYLLNRIFKKKIGCSMLRHLYLSFKYGDTLKEQQEDSKKMGHSVDMQRNYVKKE